MPTSHVVGFARPSKASALSSAAMNVACTRSSATERST
jgi:hypothetical protein